MWIRIHKKLRVDACKKIEEDQTRTVRPVKVPEYDIDFRVSGLSHAVVKEAEHLRVQELVKKSKLILIEQHFMPTCSRITCEQNTLTRHIFSCLRACFMLSHTTLAQVFVRVMPSMFHALVCLTSLGLSTLHSSEALPSSTSSS